MKRYLDLYSSSSPSAVSDTLSDIYLVTGYLHPKCHWGKNVNNWVLPYSYSTFVLAKIIDLDTRASHLSIG